MQRTTIMLPGPLKKRMLQRACELHISLGEFIRIASENFLNAHRRKWSEDPLVVGDFIVREHGPSDISENIDKYLYGRKS